MYRVITLANELLEAVPNVAMAPGMTSGLSALAKFYKGLAIGHLAFLYEELPIVTGLDHPEPEFVTRQQALEAAIALLSEARSELSATPASAEFNSDVLADGFNLENSIDAMIARFALSAGDLAEADAAAQRVTPGVTSEFGFSLDDGNPIFNIMYRSCVPDASGAVVPHGGGGGRRARGLLGDRRER
jgi:hypothetical protein